MAPIQCYQFQAITCQFQEINQLVGGVQSIHAALVLKNQYMLDLASQVITCDYLLNVALGGALGQKRLSENSYQNQTILWAKSNMSKENINLGFTILKLPDIKWLTNVLSTLNEQSSIFNYQLDRYKLMGLTNDDVVQYMIQQKFIKIFGYYLRKKRIYEFLQKNTLGRKESKNSPIKLSDVKKMIIRKKKSQREFDKELGHFNKKFRKLLSPSNQYRMLHYSKSSKNNDDQYQKYHL